MINIYNKICQEIEFSHQIGWQTTSRVFEESKLMLIYFLLIHIESESCNFAFFTKILYALDLINFERIQVELRSHLIAGWPCRSFERRNQRRKFHFQALIQTANLNCKVKLLYTAFPKISSRFWYFYSQACWVIYC